MDINRRLRTLVVSCKGMGAAHAATVASLPDQYELVGGCDLNPEVLAAFAQNHPGVKTFTDYTAALMEGRPDVVINATGNVAHAPLTIQAAQTGFVKGIYVEKPIAVSYGDAKAMVGACKEHGVYLACNHQRRMMPVFRKMRQLMVDGTIGTPELIICHNAGDILSDGTHFVDTARFLAGDADVLWVLGQVYRRPPKPDEPRAMGFQASGGWRYGHPIETGGFGIIQFRGGLRAEVRSGEMIAKGKHYQHYEVLGSKGRIIRANDNAEPPLLIQDESGGPRPVPVDAPSDRSQWYPMLMQEVFARFAQCVRTDGNAYLPGMDPEPAPPAEGEPPAAPFLAHPLSGESALKDQEVVMAIYESSRLRQRIEFPLQQDRFPLEIMIEDGHM